MAGLDWGGEKPVWSKKMSELFYRSSEGIMAASYTANSDSFAASKPRLWAAKKNLSASFDLAPDGKRFVVVMSAETPQPQETQNHVTLVVNFFDEVRRRVAAQGK